MKIAAPRRRWAMVALVVLASGACGDYVGDDLRAGEYAPRDAVVFGDADGRTMDDSAAGSVEPQPAEPAQLESGACFEDLDDPPLQAFERGEPVGIVPCDAPHRYELYAEVPLPAETGEPWPGEAAAEERARLACAEAFERFVEIEWEESSLDYLALAPSASQWDHGEAMASCALFDLGLTPLVGSMAGSGL
ncbi:MAG: septum formation family protein [Acidimicrobiales bacterium]|nr:septum formation family protein [Acidimicrobiales bacterium]